MTSHPGLPLLPNVEPSARVWVRSCCSSSATDLPAECTGLGPLLRLLLLTGELNARTCVRLAASTLVWSDSDDCELNWTELNSIECFAQPQSSLLPIIQRSTRNDCVEEVTNSAKGPWYTSILLHSIFNTHFLVSTGTKYLGRILCVHVFEHSPQPVPVAALELQRSTHVRLN